MIHKVLSVGNLYDDTTGLFNDCVIGTTDFSADTLITNLTQGIELLKSSWKGKDAGVQIQNVIVVLNALVEIRNVLGELCVQTSNITADYRDIQNSNGAGLPTLSRLNCEKKLGVENYTDNTDTIDIIPEANNGRLKIDAANNEMPRFIQETSRYFNSIMENWLSGPGRDEAKNAFGTFNSKSEQYKQTLADVSSSIVTALKNYSISDNTPAA